MSDDRPACAQHPRRRAQATCSGCGKPLCKTCRSRRDGNAWCRPCLDAAAPGETAPPAGPDALGEAATPLQTPGEASPLVVRENAPAASIAAEPPAGAPAAPPGPLPPAPTPAPPAARWLRALPALALLQAAATLLAGWAAWRAASALERAAAPPAPAALAAAGSGAPLVLKSPVLDLPVPPVPAGAPLELCGEAAYGDFVVVLVDGSTAGVAQVTHGRFAVSGLEAPAGEHDISVIAYRSAGPAVESPRVRIRFERAPSAFATPTSSPTPIARAATPLPRDRLGSARATPARQPSFLPGPESTPEADRRRARNILRGRPDRIMALTFDGGSEASQAVAVLDALGAKQVHSTIFLTGEFIGRFPAITTRIVAEGHEVGNHTFAHPHLGRWVEGRGHVTLPEMTRAVLLDELERTKALFERVTGRTMSRYWRAPYGEINAEILAWADQAGWTHIGWTEGLDSLDWVADPTDRRYRSAGEIRDRILKAARDGGRAEGGIVLMHLGGERTRDQPVAELPRLIDGLHAEGYRLVTVTSLIGG